MVTDTPEIVIPLATAGVVITPLDPVVSIVSVVEYADCTNIFGFVPSMSTNTMNKVGLNGRVSVTSAGDPADVNRPVRYCGFAKSFPSTLIVASPYRN
jgi:hypothetical protein